VQDARDIGYEEKPVCFETDRERRSRVVGVDIEGPDAERRDDGNAAGHECLDDRPRPTGQRIPDTTKSGDLNRVEPDLVSEETDGACSKCATQRPVDGREGRTNDREPCFRGDAPAADELDGDPEALHLLGDLRPGAVNDADVMARVGELQDEPGRLVRHRTAAFEYDDTHERYSALIRT
jgi:hypothetical protein